MADLTIYINEKITLDSNDRGVLTTQTITGINNIAIGRSALVQNTYGYSNIAIGTYTLSKNSTGVYNIALGIGSLSHNSTGNKKYFTYS